MQFDPSKLLSAFLKVLSFGGIEIVIRVGFIERLNINWNVFLEKKSDKV